MPTPSTDTPKATIVFQGTIKAVKAATMANIPVDDRVAIVHVDQLLESPANLRHIAGSDITVRLADRATQDQTLLFRAAGWVFGDSIAVRAVAQEPITRSHAPLLARGGDPAAHLADTTLKDRVDTADLVVSGTVLSVRLPEGSEPVPATATRGAAAPAAVPVSEHDPKWREAIVEVADVHKGEHDTRRVAVLFPASLDVRWFKAPKFHAGQQGYFILHKQTIDATDRVDVRTRGAAVAPGAPEPVEVYTALSPDDFHPYQQQERLRGLVDMGGGTRGGKER